MDTLGGAVAGVVALSAGGALPAVAVARTRPIVVPLVPLAGAAIAGLAVTAMTAVGASFLTWYLALSVICAATVGVVWARWPRTRPWDDAAGSVGFRGAHLVAGLVGLGVCAIFLGSLKAPMTQFDARGVWLLHPFWYLQGHERTVAVLRDRGYALAHPPYPPLIGGSVALTWLAAGTKSLRLGVVMIALLGALSVLAAGTAIVETATAVAREATDVALRSRVVSISVALAGGVMFVAFAAAGPLAQAGYADLVWASAAVGAVAYGLVLECTAPNVGVAAALATVAGLTKLEGSIVAAVIVGLVAVRWYLVLRGSGATRPLARAVGFAAVPWVLIGAWPLALQLLGAAPDVPFQGPREGSDATRFVDAASGFVHWAGTNVGALGGALAVAILGAVYLRCARRAAGLGSDLWAWAVICVELGVVCAAYVVGPGVASRWVQVSVARTTLFAALEAWWILTTWAVIAAGRLRYPHLAHAGAGAGVS